MTIKELKEKRESLIRQNQKEYRTKGNTQRCQEIFAEIEKVDELIKNASK